MEHISPHTKLRELTPRQIDQINLEMPGNYNCNLYRHADGGTRLTHPADNFGASIALHEERTIDDAWNLARALLIASTAPVQPARS